MDQFEENSNQGKQHSVSSHRINKKAIIVAIALFVLIVTGMFTFALLKRAEIKEEAVVIDSEEQATEVKYASITRVDAKHYFIDGLHTLVGEIPMPTPCDLLETSTVTKESFPEQVSIDFTVLNNAQFCAEVITSQRFKVSMSASEKAIFSASFMGRPIDLNLIPAGEGETPESFELFQKG